jgi:hypothetical protein
MTYEEFKTVYDKLIKNEFVKMNKPIWDMDIYTMVNEINKNYESEK